ncbi:VOC family protein [Nocardioides mangrovicus]|uniref:VOC family protein n=1 Tax=Nocardioides mangrovicus TaxID=2478913 RepID=UPI0013145A6B|nr:VOC family protein [Nocardioides mangrovicus]
MSTRLHHLALPVSDLELSVDWYERVLGAEVTRRTDVDDADLRAGRTRQAWLAVGSVVVNLAEGRAVRREEDQHFFHYALSADGDLDGWLRHLGDTGADVVGVYGHGGLSFVSVYLDDPDGYRWEVVVDYPSFEAARTAALRHGGVLGNPMTSYE